MSNKLRRRDGWVGTLPGLSVKTERYDGVRNVFPKSLSFPLLFFFVRKAGVKYLLKIIGVGFCLGVHFFPKKS